MGPTKRFIPRKGKQPVKISHQEVSQAMQAFNNKGGNITRLPEEPDPTRTQVGQRWDGMFEVPTQRP